MKINANAHRYHKSKGNQEIDKASAARLISVFLMSLYVEQRAAWTGVPLVRAALALATDDSRSPMETLMRLVWVLDAMLDPPVCNQPLFSADRLLARVPGPLRRRSPARSVSTTASITRIASAIVLT